MQEPVHGHRGDAKSCPIRPRTIICLQSDKTFLQWVILTTELYLLQGKSAPADESQVLGRKTYIYKLMSKAIADPTTRYSDNTLSVVAAAGIGETLLGNLAQGRKHLVALRLLIQRRGGSRILKDMVFGQALIITMSCIFTGTCEDTFPNKKSLREAFQSFFGTFHAMQEWNQNLRVEFEEPPSDNQDLQRYRSSRGKAFGMTSALQKYIQPLRNTTIPSERRFNLVVLWIINKMLYDLRTDHLKSVEFIQKFLSEVQRADISARNGDKPIKNSVYLTPKALFCILADRAAKYSSEDGKRWGILHAWHAIDMLELMQLAATDSREEMAVLLSSWLINDECNIWYVGERRVAEIQKEIEMEWQERRDGTKKSRPRV